MERHRAVFNHSQTVRAHARTGSSVLDVTIRRKTSVDRRRLQAESSAQASTSVHASAAVRSIGKLRRTHCLAMRLLRVSNIFNGMRQATVNSADTAAIAAMIAGLPTS
jgi:hypothetical protein